MSPAGVAPSPRAPSPGVAAGGPRASAAPASAPAAENRRRATSAFVRSLQLAYSGELGAIYAYLGHRRSLPPGPDREAIRRILIDEVHHRRAIGSLLHAFGAAPDKARERKMRRIGLAIATSCRVGGWFFPMYGAARLERDNVVEYEVAARLAWHAGRADLVDELLRYAEVEWDHERTLRERAATHALWRVVPRWDPPPPRRTIRERFETFRARPCRVRRGPIPFVR